MSDPMHAEYAEEPTDHRGAGSRDRPIYPDYGPAMNPEPGSSDPPAAGAGGRHERANVDVIPVDGNAAARPDRADPGREPSASASTGQGDADFPMPVATDASADAGQDGEAADVTRDLGEVQIRLDRLESAVRAGAGAVERNYEQSLIVLRDRAVAAETGIAQTLLRPITRQVAALIDRVELEHTRQLVDPWALTASVVDELLDILEDFGVETIECPPGMAVDRAKHRVVKTLVQRSDPDESLSVVERLRHGYQLSGYVIRPADVAAEWSQEVHGPHSATE